MRSKNQVLIRYIMSTTYGRHTEDATQNDVMWALIDGWPYEISSNGEVRNINTGRILKPHPCGMARQYLFVLLSRSGYHKSISLHALVAKAFLGQTPKGMEIDHIDGNGRNNHVSNLRFVSPSQNILGSVSRGHRGANRWNAKLTDDDAREIKEMYRNGKKAKEIAGYFDITESPVYHIISSRNWKHV